MSKLIGIRKLILAILAMLLFVAASVWMGYLVTESVNLPLIIGAIGGGIAAILGLFVSGNKKEHDVKNS
jgi:uncharacterized BrkB/YihY/UPF0761 family membrane protein